mmetsp:Transcript_37473/g.77722  ORF Transcript_37473/g.77722 Transcript_37473/m.77722 type:complete len:220 (+) Transcript_37473:351-1010(+)
MCSTGSSSSTTEALLLLFLFFFLPRLRLPETVTGLLSKLEYVDKMDSQSHGLRTRSEKYDLPSIKISSAGGWTAGSARRSLALAINSSMGSGGAVTALAGAFNSSICLTGTMRVPTKAEKPLPPLGFSCSSVVSCRPCIKTSSCFSCKKSSKAASTCWSPSRGNRPSISSSGLSPISSESYSNSVSSNLSHRAFSSSGVNFCTAPGAVMPIPRSPSSPS